LSLKKRLRRTAEEARCQILEAAEAALARSGVAGIKLQELARAVGMSHPTILHHFGSREGLVQAVVDRSMNTLSDRLVEAIGKTQDGLAPPEAVDWVFEVFGDQGLARQLTWLALSDEDIHPGDDRHLQRIAEVIHPLRAGSLAAKGRPAPTYEDTLFAVVLSAIAIIGTAVLADPLLESVGLGDDPEALGRFKRFLHRVVMGYLGGPGVGADEALP